MTLTWRVLLLIFSSLFINTILILYLSSYQQKSLHEEREEEYVKILVNSLSDSIVRDVIDGNKLRVTDLLKELKNNSKSIEYLYVMDNTHSLFTHSFTKGFPRYLYKNFSHNGNNSGDVILAHKYKTKNGFINEYSHLFIKGMDAGIYIGINQSQSESLLSSNINQIIIGSILITLILLFGTFFIMLNTMSPINSLITMIKKYKDGEEPELNTIDAKTPEVKELILTLQTVFEERDRSYKNIYENEQELSKQYKFINTIINTVPVRIFWKDLNGVYIGANRAFINDAQLNDSSNIIGKTDFDMIWKEDAQRFRDDDASVVNSGVAQLEYEEEQPRDDGSILYLVTSKVPLKDSDDNTIGILGIYSDITKYKLLQEESKKKDIQLFQQSRFAQLGEMISMIAHQWRQPLSAISATCMDVQLKSVLQTYDLGLKEEAQEYEKGVNNAMLKIGDYITNLSQTIDDFRTFYKPAKNMVKIDFETIVKRSMSIVEAFLLNDNIKVIYDYDSDSQRDIDMYDREIMQVVLNILKNAQDNFKSKQIKNPYIKVSTKNRSMMILDNGGGIPDDIIGKIFDPYFSTKDDLNGTGLGLYMSKKIIEEHHNGKILIENRDGGACFTITVGQIPV